MTYFRFARAKNYGGGFCMLGRFGIIGNPLNHSISPLLFEGIFKLLNLDYVYIPFQIRERELKPFLDSMKIKGFDGMNVTIPYKERIIPLIDEVDEIATEIGAVNTIHFSNGRIRGYNTDYYGFYKSIEEFKGGIRNSLILGGGGAGRAVLYALYHLRCKKIFLMDRNPSRRERIRKDFDFVPNLELIDWNCKLFPKIIEEVEFVINATPIGMEGFQNSNPFDVNIPLKGKIFMDLIYNPSSTIFLSKAYLLGAKIKNGLEMLLFQAMKSLEIWTGIKTKKEDWEEVYNSIKQTGIKK
jgi:shikimate dehydrogenase